MLSSKDLRKFALGKLHYTLTCLLVFTISAGAQQPRITTTVVDSSQLGYRTVIAGREYKKSGFYRFLWGDHYRREWTTPVRVPVINLDTVAGGLIATEQGGGRQTKTLRLKNPQGKEYVLRSINKDYRGALPEIAWGTFIEDLAKDQVSTAHPFASITVPPLISAAGVYHTNPRIVFVPYTPSLGEYNKTFANLLCLFEERPDDDQSDAPNFGYSSDVVGTERMLEKTAEENDHIVDQHALIRARLFDMFIGDWGRHEDQWRWAKFDSAGFKLYRPIPRDRDQMWTKFDGFFIKRITGIESLEHLQSFSHKIKNVKKYNFPARDLDRRFTNEMTGEAWLRHARELQQVLTDSLIESSVKLLPPEIFPISGEKIISKLKSRRDLLHQYAGKYYRFIAQEVNVVGSHQNELFEIKKLNHDELLLNIYDLDKEGQPKETPYYSRTFHGDETDEVNIYGLKGNDIYRIEGNPTNRIIVRLIGGTDKDSVVNLSGASHKMKYYDNRGNITVGKIRSKFSNDTAINAYVYESYKYNEGSTIKRPYYSNVRGVHLQFGYDYTKQGWRKDPFSWYQALKGYYSISNRSWGAEYEAVFNQVIGKWNVLLNANYDQKLEQYFFGFGNGTGFDFAKNAYRYYNRDAGGDVGLERPLGLYHRIGFKGFFQSVKLLKPEAHVLSHQFPFNDPVIYGEKNFTGLEAHYLYHHYNEEVVPTKGLEFTANARTTFNLTDDETFNRYAAILGFYLPLSKQFSLAVRTGTATVTGDPEFYQLVSLGGGSTLRGYFRQRFHGRTIFYNNNDLRWIFNTKNYLFNGKIGLIAFFDNGRVWQPADNSNGWHFGYGGGVMIAPFNKASVTVYYGISDETRRFHIRLGALF